MRAAALCFTARALLLLLVPLSLVAASDFVGLPSSLTEFDGRCKKLLWLTGLQFKTFKGAESSYIEKSSTYQLYLKRALLSARQNAPGVLPVVIFEGEGPAGLQAWIEAHGGRVMNHQLSFREDLIELSNRTGWEYTTGLWGSFLRVDIPPIMRKIRRLVAAHEADLDYVLWTDPDVLFLNNMDSCQLPRPQIISYGPEAARGGIGNCGVMYINVTSYTQVFPEMMAYAREQRWEFRVVDQTLLMGFFKDRWTALPDTYNWKLYWGRPEKLGWGPQTSIKVVHFHGPKMKTALCVVKALRELDVPQRDLRIGTCSAAESDNAARTVSERCSLHHVMHKDAIICLLKAAYKADKGALYLDIYEEWFLDPSRLE